MRTLIHTLASWLARKTAPVATRSRPSPWTDLARQTHAPTSGDLMHELKNVAYTCATMNAGVCATFPPKLYVVTRRGEPRPRCQRRTLTDLEQQHLHDTHQLKSARCIEEVTSHPLLTLLRDVNPTHSAHDLWEFTTLYQEAHGSAYWHLVFNDLGTPEEIWILPSQHVLAARERGSTSIVDYYELHTGSERIKLRPEEVIHFRYPNPRDPYGPGLSPLRAAFEHVLMSSEYLAYKRTLWANNALPSVIISPAEVISEEERDRMEAMWTQRFSGGGNGRVLVAESSMSVDLVQQSLADLAALAEAGASKEEIANAFGIPLSFLTTQTNLANLCAAEQQHAAKTIRPRLYRRDGKINERLIPLFDESGRLFVASDNPVPADMRHQLRQQEIDLRYGVRTVEEVRAERGLSARSSGDGDGHR